MLLHFLLHLFLFLFKIIKKLISFLKPFLKTKHKKNINFKSYPIMDSLFPDLSSFPFKLSSSAKSTFTSHLSLTPATFASQLKSFLDFLGQNQRPEKFIFSLYKLILTHIRNNQKTLICPEVSEVILPICLKIGTK